MLTNADMMARRRGLANTEVEGKDLTHCPAFRNSDGSTITVKRIPASYGDKVSCKMGVYRGWRDVQQHDRQVIPTRAVYVTKKEWALVK